MGQVSLTATTTEAVFRLPPLVISVAVRNRSNSGDAIIVNVDGDSSTGGARLAAGETVTDDRTGVMQTLGFIPTASSDVYIRKIAYVASSGSQTFDIIYQMVRA